MISKKMQGSNKSNMRSRKNEYLLNLPLPHNHIIMYYCNYIQPYFLYACTHTLCTLQKNG